MEILQQASEKADTESHTVYYTMKVTLVCSSGMSLLVHLFVTVGGGGCDSG